MRPQVPTWFAAVGSMVAVLVSAPSKADVRAVDDPELAPAWAVPYGGEFWLRAPEGRPTVPHTDGELAATRGPGLRDVIERVDHAFRADLASGIWAAQSDTYSFELEDGAVRLAPYLADGPDGTTVQIATTRIARGDWEARADPAMPAQWLVLGNTAQADWGGGIVEHWETTGEGPRVTWVLEAPPAGVGDLRVEQQLWGLTVVATTVSGVHFGTDDGTARLLVRQPVAVDSAGRQWALAAAVVNGALEIVLPESVIVEATYPLAIDPVIQAEQGVDQGVVAADPDSDNTPSVATNGTEFFIVWGSASVIRGARVRVSDGMLLSPAGIDVSDPASATANYPTVAYDSGYYFAVWEDTVNGLVSGIDVWGARIIENSNTVSGRIQVTNTALADRKPDVAGDEGYFLVAWAGNADSDIRAARVQANPLALLDGAPGGSLSVATTADVESRPHVASMGTAGSRFLISYQRAPFGAADVYAARVTTAGGVVDVNGFAVASGAAIQGAEYYSGAPVAFDGTNFVVVWETNQNFGTSGTDLYGRFVPPVGLPGAAEFQLTSGGAAAHETSPAVAFAGSDYLVTWTRSGGGNTNVFGTVFSTAGVVVHAQRSITTDPGAQIRPHVAFAGSTGLVAWDDDDNLATTQHDIFAVRINGSGLLADPAKRVVSTAATTTNMRQRNPAVASNGTNQLIVWSDWRNSTTYPDIYAARVRISDGAILDPSGIAVATAVIRSETDPAVAAAAGGNFFVAWHETYTNFIMFPPITLHGIKANIVTSAGGALLGSTVTVGTYNSAQLPAVAVGSTTYGVVWQDSRSGGATPWDIYAAPVTVSGNVLTPGAEIVVSSAAENQTGPALAWDGTMYLTAWTDRRQVAVTLSDIYAARLDEVAGALSWTQEKVVSAGSAVEQQPTVASNGVNLAIFWEDNRNAGSSGYDIYGCRAARKSASFVVGPPIEVSTASNSQFNASAASDGTDYVAVWNDLRGGSVLDVYAARIRSTDGVLLDGPASTGGVFIQAGPALYPVAAHRAAEKYTVGYQRFDVVEDRVKLRCAALGVAGTCP